MKFNVDKLRKIAKPASEESLDNASFRDENREWLRKSALLSLSIERILRTRGISKQHFASELGVSSSQVTKILSGKENFGLKTIVKIEDALGIELMNIPNLHNQYIAVIEDECPIEKPKLVFLNANKCVSGCATVQEYAESTLTA